MKSNTYHGPPQPMHVVALEQVTAQQQRAALGQFATGVCILSSRDSQGERFGMTINSFGSVSLAPPLVLWTLDKSTVDLDRYLNNTHFGVSVLARDQGALCYAFADDRLERFEGLDWPDSPGGCPVVPGALAFFDCQIDTRHDTGDHILVIARVTGMASPGGEPLVFQAGALADALVMRDGAPENAPFTDRYSGALIGRASDALNRDFAATLPNGLKAVHWRVLACLTESSRSVNALAEQVLLKQPTLTRVLDSMVADGLVSRTADTNDRRRVQVSATASGLALGRQLQQAATEHETRYFDGWTEAERAALDQLMRRVISSPNAPK